MIDTSGNKPVIQVKMFGGFTITMDDKSMGDSDNRSRKAWNLLSYLIINRRKDVSINELFQAIWQDGMQDNPYGALKTLVFRVRKMMEAAGFPSQDLIPVSYTHLKSKWKVEIEGAGLDAAQDEDVRALRALFKKDPIKRMNGASAMVQRWKQEYRMMV